MPVNLTRPRIYLTPAVLARAKARVAAGDPRWLALKARADQPASWDVRPIAYATAFALTGDAAYADRAIELAGVFVGQGVDAVTDDDGYFCRLVLPEEAITYDWCYDRLTANERAMWRAAMEAQCRVVWPETGGTLSTHWGGWPSSNYYHGFQMTWLVGLALAGESALAADLISQGRARHLREVLPRMTAQWSGGYLEEGTSYGVGSLMWMAYYLTAHLTAGADAPDTILPPQWYPSVLRAIIHLTTPDLAHLYPGGDQALQSSAPVTDYTRAPVLAMMDTLGPADAGFAQQWLADTSPGRYPIASTLWMPLLWQSDAPVGDYRTAFPTTYSMPGVGVYTARSDWTPRATQVVAVAGDVIEDSHQDQTGTVMLWRGGWLAAAAKLASHGGIEHDAPNLNTVTIGGTAQPAQTDGCRAFYTHAEAGFVSWAAALTQAYPDLLVDWRREWLFLPPNWLVLLDRIRTKDAATSKEWRLHTLNAPMLSGMKYRASSGGGTLFGTAVLPTVAPTQEAVGTGGYRIKHVRTGETLSTFLHVWEVAPSSQSAPSPVASSVVDATHLTLSLAGKAVNVDLSLDTSQIRPALTLAGSMPPPPTNQPPVANAGGPYAFALMPGNLSVMVLMDGSKSVDPDGQIVNYRWHCDAWSEDGVTSSPRYAAVFTKAGTYTVTLTVTDNQGATNTATTTATISAAPPPVGDLSVAINTFESSPTGARFAGLVGGQQVPLPAGSTITVTARTPDGRTGTGSATISGSTPPPGPTVLLSEPFDGSAPSSLWMPGAVVSGGARDPAVPVVVGGGVLTISPRANVDGSHYNGLMSAQTYDLTGAQASVEVPQVTAGSANTQFALVLDGSNFYLVEIEAGRIYFTDVTKGVRTQLSTPYGSVSHRFWRIRHNAAAASILWETSADGKAWNVGRPASVSVPLTALRLELAAGTWERVAAPGKAVFDNVRIERP